MTVPCSRRLELVRLGCAVLPSWGRHVADSPRICRPHDALTADRPRLSRPVGISSWLAAGLDQEPSERQPVRFRELSDFSDCAGQVPSAVTRAVRRYGSIGCEPVPPHDVEQPSCVHCCSRPI